MVRVCKSVALHCSCLNGPRQTEPLGHCGLLMLMASTAQKGVLHPGTEDKAAGHDHNNAVSRGEGPGVGGVKSSSPHSSQDPRSLGPSHEIPDCLPALSLVASHSPVPQRCGPVGLPAPLSFTEVQLPVYHLCHFGKCYYDNPSLYSVSTCLSCVRESTLPALLIQTTVRTR